MAGVGMGDFREGILMDDLRSLRAIIVRFRLQLWLQLLWSFLQSSITMGTVGIVGDAHVTARDHTMDA